MVLSGTIFKNNVFTSILFLIFFIVILIIYINLTSVHRSYYIDLTKNLKFTKHNISNCMRLYS